MDVTAAEILKQYWGYDAFRSLQEEIIHGVVAGRDTLALLPTGGGKSICFQVPGMMLEGMTLVVSPLIALMRDQVEGLNRRGIAAAYINSSLDWKEIDRKLNAAMEGRYKFLYLAPERLGTEMFRVRLQKMKVSLLAIDEAHCVSQWGYDFRPAYLRIPELKAGLPHVPVIALTATATPEVREDIAEKLQLKNPAVFVKSFRRDNLSYSVLETEDVFGRIRDALERLPGTGIIYARTRKLTVQLAQRLNEMGVSASAYHGGLPSAERTDVQQKWLRNDLRLMVATNAFGMGIDKPDVRFVFHYNLPGDLESYYQEAGRAGRDGKTAYAVAFINARERDDLQRWTASKYPSWEEVLQAYDALCNFYRVANGSMPEEGFRFDAAEIAGKFHLPLIPFYHSVKLLANEGIVALDENPSDYASARLTAPPQGVLRYKEEHPTLAPLIDFMLRTLGGDLFSEERKFLPYSWAKKLAMSPAALEELLHVLHMRNIIDYKPATAHPVLRFTVYRHVLTRNELNWHKYNFLIHQGKERLDALLKYAVAPAEGCRSRMLETYFGETTTSDCGVCDYCRQQGGAGRKKMEEELRVILAGGRVEFGSVVGRMTSGSAEERELMIREWMDRGVVRIVDGMYLELGG